MDAFLRDLRLALRTLRARPAFTLAVVATLALGVGASTAVFSVVNAALLRPLPFAEPERLAFVRGVAGPERDVRGASFPELGDWRDGARRGLAGVSAYEELALNLHAGDRTARVDAERVSANFFALLGVRPALGRGFLADEDRVPDAHPVAVVSDALWRTQLGADPDVVGRSIELNDRLVTVVGVMPPEFRGLSFDTDVWVPTMMISLTDAPTTLERRGSRWLGAVARLAPGATPALAQQELDAVAARLARDHPETNTDRGVWLLELREYYLGATRPLLLALFAAAALLLLIACANVAGLQLVRASARGRETAVRLALGASTRHLLRQLLAEGTVLGVLGAGAGALVATWGVALLLPLVPDGVLPGYVRVTPDARVLLFAAGLAALSAVLIGLAPAARARRLHVAGVLKEGGRSAAGGITTLRRPGAQQILVVGEVALALVLLAGAGLMLRSLQQQLAVDPGFRAEGVLRGAVTLPAERYTADEARRFSEALAGRLQGRPGVRAAALGSDLPMDGNTSAATLRVEGRPDDEGVRYYRHRVSAGYFAALGIPIVRGRGFGEADRADAAPVVVVSAAGARRLWPDGDAVGRRIVIGGDTATVVGVAGTARFRDLTTDLGAAVAEPDVYLPLAQMPARELSIAVRAECAPGSDACDARALAGLLRREVAALDAGLPVYGVESLADALRGTTASGRFGAMTFALFGGAALLLAAVGLYGLLAFVVGLSAHEIAIRLALGATGSRVTRLMVRQGMLLVVAGLAIGLALAALTTDLLADHLFGVGATDPATFAVVSLVLLVTAFVATWLPARRATRVDPQQALKDG